jgi:hypothetical protein
MPKGTQGKETPPQVLGVGATDEKGAAKPAELEKADEKADTTKKLVNDPWTGKKRRTVTPVTQYSRKKKE